MVQLPGADERTLGEILGIVRELAAGHPAVEGVDGYTDAQFAAAPVAELLGPSYDEFIYAHDSTGTVCRRLAAAYPMARKVCIGDAFGMVYAADFVAAYQPRSTEAIAKDGLKALAVTLRLRMPGFPPIVPDVAALVLPVDPSGHGLRGVNLVCCAKQDFIDAIKQCHANARDLQEYLRTLLDETSEPRYLLLTETYVEAGHLRPEREVPMYCEIVRAHCEPGSTVIVKPHPLEAPGKGARITGALRGEYKVLSVPPRFARLPIEIWLDLLQACKVICTAYPVLSLKYAYDIDVVQPMNEAFIERWIEPAFQRWVRDSLDLYMKPLERLREWNGREVLWSGRP